MRFRLGLAVGFTSGYYFGSKAGRERYEQISRAVSKVKRSDAFEMASEKAKAAADLGVERAKGLVDNAKGNSSGVNGITVDVPKTDPPVRP
ncbi:MAG: YtxH domain-containing protein [Acidimicrobiales bacterium]